jgi:hypothetical protein
MGREEAKSYLDMQTAQLDLAYYGADEKQKAYDYAVQNYGFKGTYNSYIQEQNKIEDSTKPPSSYQEWSLAGGEAGTGQTYAEFIAKSSAASTPKAYQYTAANFATRIEQASTILDSLDEKFTGYKSLIGGMMPEALKGEERKSLEQAQRNFGTAVLRRESGAAIAQSEFDNLAKQYFPQVGDSQAILDQKKANRDLVLANMINEAGPALSETAPQLLNKRIDSNLQGQSYTTPDQLLNDYPQLQDNIDSIIQEFTNRGEAATPDKILQRLEEQIGFTSSGGGTLKASPKVASQLMSVETGEKAGQCGRFVNKITGLGVGDSYQSKMAKMDPRITYPEPGMVFTMPYKDTGHIGFIVGIRGDKALVKDSNYSLDEKVKIHEIPISKMTGFRMV